MGYRGIPDEWDAEDFALVTQAKTQAFVLPALLGLSLIGFFCLAAIRSDALSGCLAGASGIVGAVAGGMQSNIGKSRYSGKKVGDNNKHGLAHPEVLDRPAIEDLAIADTVMAVQRNPKELTFVDDATNPDGEINEFVVEYRQ